MKRFCLLIVLFQCCISYVFSQNMEWLCHPGKYDVIEYMGYDLFKIRNSIGKWGIISSEGNIKLETKYDSITAFMEERSLILDKSGKKILGIINENAELVKSFKYDNYYITNYSYYKEGLLGFKIENGLCGYLNKQGGISIKPRFYLAAPFQNGIATVQYADGDGYFGLINKSGGSAIVSDTKYKFLSSIVEGKLLGVTASRRGGDVLEILELQEGRLIGKDKLESKMFVDMSDDFTYLYSQNGHHYMIDNQWRIYNTNYNLKMPYIINDKSPLILESSELLSKQFTQNGMLITYLGKPILEHSFNNVSTYEKKYAIVTSKNRSIGVLRLNPSAGLDLILPSKPKIFYHNPNFKVDNAEDINNGNYTEIEVDLKAVNPSDLKFYINNNGYMIYAPFRQKGENWILSLPYFVEDSMFENIKSKSVDVAITYDGLDWMHRKIQLSSKHKEGFAIKMLGDDLTNDEGKSTVHFDIESVGGIPQNNVYVEISGKEKSLFKGNKKRFSIPVYVEEGKTKTLTFKVSISEMGCPTIVKTFLKKVTHPKKEKTEDEEIILY